MLKRSLLAVSLVAALLVPFTAATLFPSMHKAWVRATVASKVFEVRGEVDGGGGTGFAIEAPSGVSYIVTNSHVCESSLEVAHSKNILLVIRDGHAMKRRVLEISEKSDLCLIEGWPNIQGLKLGGEVSIGDVLYEIGHPLLAPTTMAMGEVTAFMDVALVHHLMGDTKLGKMMGGTDEPCNQPKNFITKIAVELFDMKLGDVNICMVKESDAIVTSIPTYPGNSGSPVVNGFAHVVGVAFASDNTTFHGLLVNIKQLKDFLKDF